MATPLPDSASRVQEHLKSQGCAALVVELPSGTRTAVAAAQAVGCDAAQIAKSIVFRAAQSGRAVLVVAHQRPPVTFIDAHLLSLPTIRAAAGTPATVFALTPEELVRLTAGQVAGIAERPGT